MVRFLLVFILGCACPAWGAPLDMRVVAANLTSSNGQSWSPDNGNHSNPEGAGARILAALKPDVVLIQEFNTAVPARQWVNRTLGEGYHFTREEGKQLPNGIISRHPIVESGAWDDPVLENREFVWARLRLPEDRDLWVVSVHLHSKSATSRARQATSLVAHVRSKVPKDAMLVIGGDLNTRSADEECLKILAGVVRVPGPPPADDHGNPATNAPRSRPYDWVLAARPLDGHRTPVKLAGREFSEGLVFDTRVFVEIGRCPPAQPGDSGVPGMQHMAVVRDFRIP